MIEPVKYNHTGKVLKIVDEFAIGFAEWISDNRTIELWKGIRTYKELLEIYKKEKGL